MARVTFFMDSAGRVSQDTGGHEWLTVAGVAVPTGELDSIRRLTPARASKWSHASPREASGIVNFALYKATAGVVLQIHKKQPTWDEFWRDADRCHQRMSSSERSRVGFVKANTVIRYAAFGDCSGPLLAECVKRQDSQILDAQGRRVIALAVVSDTDIQGQENRDTFRFLWDRYAAKSRFFRNHNMRLIVEDVDFRTEEQEPILLLPDHIAGCLHCDACVPDSDLPRRLDRNAVTMLASRIRSSPQITVIQNEFDIRYGDIFGDL